MKKESVKRLLTEMIDREFQTDEIADVFYYIDHLSVFYPRVKA